MVIKNIPGSIPNSVFKNAEFVKSDQASALKDNTKSDNLKSSNSSLIQETEKTKKTVEEITTNLNKMVRVFNRKIDFIIHDDTHRMMVKVVDTESGKTLREIPPEEILDLVAKMQETFSIFFDVRV